ncbi:MAG: polyamine aminopropyltransferase [Desulfobacterales bacterium]|nr:polyamine aminopropyltransferase [Desulfobacterales bacterium]
MTDNPLPSKRRFTFNTATFLLGSSMFATGATGLVLEYIQAAVGTYILGNSIEQYSIVIGLMLFMMGVAAKVQKYFNDDLLLEKFILIEIFLAIIGGYAPIATYWAYGVMDNFLLVQYFFIMSIGFLIGLEIPVVMRINEQYCERLSLNIERVFAADYIGSLVGALLWVYVLLKKFPITESSFIMAGVNFAIAVVTYTYFRHRGLILKKISISVLIAITAFSILLGYRYNRDWNLTVEQRLYDDPIVFSRTTQYQHLVMTHSPVLDEYRFYINGNLQFSSVDEHRYHEMLVHPVMNLVPDHRRVLILGGGDGMALREVLKYPEVREVMLVDLDPDMTRLGANTPVLRRLNAQAFDDARVTKMAADGLTPGEDRPLFQETGKKNKAGRLPVTEKIATVRVMNVDADRFLSGIRGKWNVVLVDLPDPSSIDLVKLYSKGFYLKIRRVLAETGMVAIQATSPYHARESFLCIQRTLEAARMHTLPYHENVPSFGDWGWFLAWKDSLPMAGVAGRIAHMDMTAPTRYLTPEVFRRSLVFGKTELESPHTDVNTLMFPVLLNYYLKESWLVD